MSEWSALHIDGYELGTAQNHADPDALSLFQESDKRLCLGVRIDEKYYHGPWMSLGEIEELAGRDQGAVQLVYLKSLEEWTIDADQDDYDESHDEIMPAPPRAHADDSPADSAVHAGDPLAYDVLPLGWIEARIDAVLPVAGHCYVTTAQYARERLDAMGYTLARAAGVLSTTTAQSRVELDPSIARLRAECQ